MSLTGRLSAALLIAACLTVPAGAQTGDDYDDLTLDAPIETPDSNDWGEVTHHPETDLETLEQAHRDYLRKSTLQLERPEADPVEFDPPSPPPKHPYPPPRRPPRPRNPPAAVLWRNRA